MHPTSSPPPSTVYLVEPLPSLALCAPQQHPCIHVPLQGREADLMYHALHSNCHPLLHHMCHCPHHVPPQAPPRRLLHAPLVHPPSRRPANQMTWCVATSSLPGRPPHHGPLKPPYRQPPTTVVTSRGRARWLPPLSSLAKGDCEGEEGGEGAGMRAQLW